jgi:hypothetical protein
VVRLLSDVEISLIVEFEELFGLRDRLRPLADEVRHRLYQAGLRESLESEIFESELELRTAGKRPLTIRLDSFHLEIAGARKEFSLPNLAALLLEEAHVFRLTSVEAGYSLAIPAKGKPLDLVARAFAVPPAPSEEPMLDRRFSMTWDWGSATTGYSFLVQSTEDPELFLSMKVREGYMTVPELQGGAWLTAQSDRFQATAERFLQQIGWQK